MNALRYVIALVFILDGIVPWFRWLAVMVFGLMVVLLKLWNVKDTS